jgi:Na+-transporting NADH:ubiquinone oxidoreductase subunit NqrF
MNSSDYCYDWAAIEPGTPVKIAGERGEFVFRKVDRNGDVEVFGGSSGRLMVRTFRADRLRVKGHRRKVVKQ